MSSRKKYVRASSVGQSVVVLKCAYALRMPFSSHELVVTGAPQRGDVVLLRSPQPPHHWLVSRVVGLAGDTIALNQEVLVVNGASELLVRSPGPSEAGGEFTELAREQIGGTSHSILLLPTRIDAGSFGPVTVPAGAVFVLGDNRDETLDSRLLGCVPISSLVGRVLGRG
jgi:signal peptidase I